MRASALLSVLLLGTGVAAADTKPETDVGRVQLQDQQTPPKPRAPSQWLELADATPAKHGTEFFVVGAQQGSFSRLRIEAAKGRTNVKRVTVVFVDGTKKTYKVDATVFEKGRKFAEIDLGMNKPIEQLVVTTDRFPKGEYALYGSSGGGSGSAVSSR
ncbi:MAG TPA: hypothetical protein VL326_05230 [Kofleriaceae bacterium]|jgi:hypothetical protein|nr:hypothetical protein [Kofleriaceae bacterium]